MVIPPQVEAFFSIQDYSMMALNINHGCQYGLSVRPFKLIHCWQHIQDTCTIAPPFHNHGTRVPRLHEEDF